MHRRSIGDTQLPVGSPQQGKDARLQSRALRLRAQRMPGTRKRAEHHGQFDEVGAIDLAKGQLRNVIVVGNQNIAVIEQAQPMEMHGER